MARRALLRTRVMVRMYANGQYVRKSSIIFERMSPADVWNLIATAARAQLFRVPVKTAVRRKRVKP